MALNLYRRHRRDCNGGHREDSRSGEVEERKKGWKRCVCPIFASGTLGTEFRRKRTDTDHWEVARVVAGRWEAAGVWDTPTSVVETPVPKPDATCGVSIVEAGASFLASRQNRGVSVPTLSKYRTFTKQLAVYAGTRGVVLVGQLTVADMDRFYASWKDGKRARAKKLERLKAFVKFCLKRKWLDENIAEDLEAPEGSSFPANKTPFTDAELERIYAACDSIVAKPAGPGHRNWSGEDVKDFIMLSVYTGMRISDVATFDTAKRLKGNDVFLRMHKTNKELYTWIPDWLVSRLRAREQRHGALIFRTGESLVMRTMAELWRVKLARTFELASPFDERPTPHRFRHTFVRILLEKGVPIADVAELIGDTEEVVRKHYAKWVPERQARLTRILEKAFEGKANPRVVAIC